MATPLPQFAEMHLGGGQPDSLADTRIFRSKFYPNN